MAWSRCDGCVVCFVRILCSSLATILLHVPTAPTGRSRVQELPPVEAITTKPPTFASPSSLPILIMSDPLLLLRAALSTGATITLHAGPSLTSPQVYTLPLCTHIALPSSPSSPAHIFPKDTPTRYLTAPSATTSFDLQTLLLAYLHRELGTGDYFKQAREASSGFVGIIDRKSVVEWLSGKTALEGVEERIVPLISSEKRAATDSSTTGGEGGKSGSAQKKARYVVDKGDQERVARMMSLVEGPSYATVRGDSELKYERTGGAVINRESVLRGDRINVSILHPGREG